MGRGNETNEVAALCERQHGVIHRRQALALGLTDRMIHRRTGAGIWTIEAPSVYRIAGTPVTWWTRLAVASLRTGGVASHTTAGYLLGINGLGQGRYHVTVPDWQERCRGVVVHRTTRWDLVGSRERHGIATSGVERTVVDLARYLDPHRLSSVIDDVVGRRLTTVEKLLESATAHSERGRKGVPALREQLDERLGEVGAPQTDFNRLVAALLVRQGLPRPVFEHPIYDGDRLLGRVDLAYPPQRLAIECQSKEFHFNLTSFNTDPARRAEITRLGWQVIDVTWATYRNHGPWFAEVVRDHLKQRRTSSTSPNNAHSPTEGVAECALFDQGAKW